MSTVTTTTTELPDSRVRVDVEVGPDALERELNGAAKALGREMKVPGFRKGRVPPEVVLQRVGREAVLDEAVRRGLPAWYEQAVADAGVATVGDPKLDLAGLPGKGDPLSFSIEVGVRPPAKLGKYKGVEAGRHEPVVEDDEVAAELERLRESVASLETVDRPARTGDFAVLDFTGTIDGAEFEGGQARGYLLELGSGRLIEGFEEQLAGAAAGESREVRVTFPADYGNEELAGKEAAFAVEVKEVKEKQLPQLDDDFAAEAGGFDSLEELREDVRARIGEVRERQVEDEYRAAVLDAVVDKASVDVPRELVHAKAHELWTQTARSLERRGLSPATYLQMTGKSEEELVTDSEPEAERSLMREAVLAAVVEAEGIEASDEEMLDALRAATAAPGGEQPGEEELRSSLARAKEQGRDEGLREDIAMRKALDVLVEHAKPIPAERAKAREELWTPDKERPKEGRLWTPGS